MARIHDDLKVFVMKLYLFGTADIIPVRGRTEVICGRRPLPTNPLPSLQGKNLLFLRPALAIGRSQIVIMIAFRYDQKYHVDISFRGYRDVAIFKPGTQEILLIRLGIDRYGPGI
jgi:hypothetical protein